MNKSSAGNSGYDFEKVYTEFYPRLRRFVRNYTRSGIEADNILQDVFAELWENWNIHSKHHNIFGYLFVSVKNRCVDYLRKKQQRIRAEAQLKDAYIAEYQLNIRALGDLDIGDATMEEVEKVITAAIESLPEKCRDIFIKSKLEGKKQKEIAREMNISVNTVESQMAIAYKKLRKELGALFPLIFLFISLIE
ncbi:MAG: RNA polymerase sigma-70 factor [Rikenellaceae bacterium]|nr:RNA polymerase sigma-70 factor [Rikenellaceae bacterium]